VHQSGPYGLAISLALAVDFPFEFTGAVHDEVRVIDFAASATSRGALIGAHGNAERPILSTSNLLPPFLLAEYPENLVQIGVYSKASMLRMAGISEIKVDSGNIFPDL
jgi:hypothetical protein